MIEEVEYTRSLYRRVHGVQYERLKVGDLLGFCGWQVLLELVKEAENIRYYENPSLSKDQQNSDVWRALQTI